MLLRGSRCICWRWHLLSWQRSGWTQMQIASPPLTLWRSFPIVPSYSLYFIRCMILRIWTVTQTCFRVWGAMLLTKPNFVRSRWISWVSRRILAFFLPKLLYFLYFSTRIDCFTHRKREIAPTVELLPAAFSRILTPLTGFSVSEKLLSNLEYDIIRYYPDSSLSKPVRSSRSLNSNCAFVFLPNRRLAIAASSSTIYENV